MTYASGHIMSLATSTLTQMRPSFFVCFSCQVMVPVDEFSIWFHCLVICVAPVCSLGYGSRWSGSNSWIWILWIVAAGSQGYQVWGICYHPFFIGEYQVQGCWCAVVLVTRWHKRGISRTFRRDMKHIWLTAIASVNHWRLQPAGYRLGTWIQP